MLSEFRMNGLCGVKLHSATRNMLYLLFYDQTVVVYIKNYSSSKTACNHMMPSPLHVCSGLTRPVDKSVWAQDIWT